MRRKISLAVGVILCVLLLSACANRLQNLFDGEDISSRSSIKAFNQKGFDLMEEGRTEEAITQFEKAIDAIYEAKPELKELSSPIQSSEVYDSPFNNMSWAYHDLGDYEKSLEYIEIALLLLPNTDTEYINKGNALYGLARYDEAMEQYEKAIDYDNGSIYAHYGKGMIHYDRSQYREALQSFNAFLKKDESDYDALEMKVYSHIALGESAKALDYAEHIIGKYPDDYHVYRLKAIVLGDMGDFEASDQFHQELKAQFPDNPDVMDMLGEFYADYGYFDEAVAVFRDKLRDYPEDADAYWWLIGIYDGMGEYEEAKTVYGEALDVVADKALIHEKMGDTAYNFGFYLDAADYYGYAAQALPDEPLHYMQQLSSLYSANRNVRCVELGQTARELFPDHSDIAWYSGLCQVELGEYEAAIQDLSDAAETDPESSEAWAQLAYANLLYGDEGKAREYSDRSLKLYSGNYTAEMVKESLKEKNKPIGSQIKAFFEENYLYLDAVEASKELLSELDQPDIPLELIAERFEKAKKKGDQFSFMIYGDDYDQLGYYEENDLELTEEGSMVYIRIPTFHMRTDDAFIDIIDRIDEPESKNLVLDLRGNGGGIAQSANIMLDALLPDYVTSMMIYRNGQTENFYSDPSYTEFRHIYILVDENSASASELLTLGLKSYLSNVTIVGRDTYGKGVGQYVFDDPVHKVLLYVVNFYWNVKQKNISDDGIKPDVYVQGNSLEAFMKPVRDRMKP
ncbi:S41 family peptidase [Paenibacillus sp. CAU 1782]